MVKIWECRLNTGKNIETFTVHTAWWVITSMRFFYKMSGPVNRYTLTMNLQPLSVNLNLYSAHQHVSQSHVFTAEQSFKIVAQVRPKERCPLVVCVTSMSNTINNTERLPHSTQPTVHHTSNFEKAHRVNIKKLKINKTKAVSKPAESSQFFAAGVCLALRSIIVVHEYMRGICEHGRNGRLYTYMYDPLFLRTG